MSASLPKNARHQKAQQATVLAALMLSVTLATAHGQTPSMQLAGSHDDILHRGDKTGERPRFTRKQFRYYRWAIETDDVNRLEPLVDEQNMGPNAIFLDGTPALILAMQQEAANVVEWLIKHPQLDVNQRNTAGDSALMIASGMGQLGWVQNLISRGAEQDSGNGWTPLHYAAANGQLSIVQYLLKQKGVNIDAPSANATTPLMMAARANATEVVRELTQKGAKIALENQSGQTALSYARRHGNLEMESILAKGLMNTPMRLVD